jgi:hypothetical protein
MAEYLTTAAKRYEDNLRSEKSILVTNWEHRYRQMTEDKVAVLTIRGIPVEQIDRYMRQRVSSMYVCMQRYADSLEKAIPARIRVYVNTLRIV